MPTIALPTKDRTLEPYATSEPIVFPSKEQTQSFNRIAYAAAHVVADPLADIDPWDSTAVDWEKTIAFRHYLWDLGLGVAEAMDTAQRGGGLGWSEAKQLIGHALDAAKTLDRASKSAAASAPIISIPRPIPASTGSSAHTRNRSKPSRRSAANS